ncbi:MAG: hypothetical protein KDC87_18820, partial [Planctomycetes bacterium]|nr:hypothetical protein [Planctomycetota bacterium]
MRTPRLIGCGVLAGLLSVVVPAQSARRNARLDRVLDGLIVDLGRQEAMGDAYERLLAIGKPAVPRLLRAVLPGVGTAQLRWRRALALRLLGDLGPHSVAALDPLIQAMWQLGGWDRDECMRAIARIAPYSRRSMQDLGLGTSTVGRYWLDAEICAARVEFGPRPDPKQVAAALIADYRSGVARQRMVRSFAALQLLADGACPAFRDRDGVLARAFDATRQGIYIYTTSVVDLRWLKECAALALVRHAPESDLRFDALAMLLAHPRASVARSAFRELQPELDSGGERAVGLLKRG